MQYIDYIMACPQDREIRFIYPNKNVKSLVSMIMSIKTSPNENGFIDAYSLSGDPPIKRGKFSIPFEDFKGKTSYKEWIFGLEFSIQNSSNVVPFTCTLNDCTVSYSV